jgi:predicted dehydrogenase
VQEPIRYLQIQEAGVLRAAIFGVGRWGSRLIESVADSDKIRVTTAISRDPSRHKEFSQRTGIKVVKSYARVLKSPEIDAVILAGPQSLHCAQTLQAAKAGKHVFSEKPFTLTRKSAEKAIAACEQAQITLGVGFNRRFAPAFVEMVRRIEAGEIGEILLVEGENSGPTGYSMKPGNWRGTRKEAPGGGMTARGIHALDCMIRIAGAVSSVYASSQKRVLPAEVDMDDTTTMLLKFARGAVGNLTTVFVTGDCARVRAVGSKGWLEMRGDTELTARGLEGPARTIELPALDKERAELEAFADAVAAKRPFTVPYADIINGVAVLESIEKSSARGKPIQIA